MVEAVVEYDYTAQETDELTIRKGDIIREIVKKPGGWWEGTLRDKRGMFPDNFVTVIQKDKVILRSKPNRVRQCRAIFSYHPAQDDELSLAVGDVIDIICEVEEGWWKGKLGNQEGVFPSNFVAEIDPNKLKSGSKEDLMEIENETPNLPPKPTKIICQVKYPYEACNDDELTLKEGDLINLISKDGQDKGWWRGELRGQIGVFPDNFVIVLPIHENQKTEITSEKREKTERKSLEAPPVPGKKPNVPKKSPMGIRVKSFDKIDGASISKNSSEDCEFDHVERCAMLPDMRANRVKAPGRRPPKTLHKEFDAGLVNGNSEHQNVSDASNDDDEEKKPKMREWEKHKVPWVEELKLNQAKRTEESEMSLTNKSRSSVGEEMSKSLTSLTNKSRSSIGESATSPSPTTAPLRLKSPQNTPPRPQSIHGAISPGKPPVAEKINISPKQYLELMEKVMYLETKMQQQMTEMQSTINDLREKLQNETDARLILETELEKVAQCVTQV